MMANRAIYHDGWVAATTPARLPWDASGELPPVDDYKWELYNVAKDFTEAVNLADKEPAKLRELQDLFWVEASKYNVLPLDNSLVSRFDVSIRPSLTRGRSVFTYYDGQTRIPEGSAPDLKNKSFKIGADVEIPDGGAEGAERVSILDTNCILVSRRAHSKSTLASISGLCSCRLPT
jgi:arylsulfatase